LLPLELPADSSRGRADDGLAIGVGVEGTAAPPLAAPFDVCAWWVRECGESGRIGVRGSAKCECERECGGAWCGVWPTTAGGGASPAPRWGGVRACAPWWCAVAERWLRAELGLGRAAAAAAAPPVGVSGGRRRSDDCDDVGRLGTRPISRESSDQASDDAPPFAASRACALALAVRAAAVRAGGALPGRCGRCCGGGGAGRCPHW